MRLLTAGSKVGVLQLEQFLPKANHLGQKVYGRPHRDDRRGLFFFPCFRGVLRLGGDRRVLERARCSEHEVIREVLNAAAESRIWGFAGRHRRLRCFARVLRRCLFFARRFAIASGGGRRASSGDGREGTVARKAS